MSEALRLGHLDDCRALRAAGAGSPDDLSEREQAEWMLYAIGAPCCQAEMLDLLLKAGFDPSRVYDELGPDYQSTAASAAAEAARLDLLQMLEAAGADLHWRSPTGTNAYSEALPSLTTQAPRPDSPERQEVLAWLAERGVRLDPRSQDSRRKIIWAARGPISWPDVPVLMSLGVDPAPLRWTPFMMRVASGEATVEEVNALSGAELSHQDNDLRTPFLLAITAGRRDLAEALLALGSDPLAKGWCGAGALHLAAKHGHVELLDWLVSLGIPLEDGDQFDDTPLQSAVVYDQVEAARRLLQLGADPCRGDDNGFRMVHQASSQRMLELLLDAGADVNDVSGGGTWPLKDASADGDAELVRYLLARGADPNLTSTGETALFGAVGVDSLECASLLLDSGADINACDVDGWTCLWFVRSMPMAELLLSRGADPALGDQYGGLPEKWSVPTAVAKLFRERRLSAAG